MEEILPKDWTYARLDEVADVVAGNPAPQGAEFYDGGQYPFVRVHDMGENGRNVFLSRTRDLVNERAAKKMRIFPSGSVLFTKSGASTLLNQRAILSQDSFVVSHIAAAIPNCEIESKWLYYFLCLVDFAELAHATNMPSLPLSRAKAIKIPLAPKRQQRRIVAKIEELFSELDKGIESLKTAREQLKVYRQAVLKHAFEGKLTAKWREENKDKLESPEQLLARIQKEREARYQQQLDEWKEAVKAWERKGKHGKKPLKPKSPSSVDSSSIDVLENGPDNWIAVKLRELFETTQNGLSKRKGITGKLIPVLKLADIKNQEIDKSDLRVIKLDATEIKKYRLNKGDLVCIRVNGSSSLVGRMILVKHDDVIAYCDHFIRFQFPRQIVLPSYIQMYFDTQVARRYIDLNKVSSAGQNTVSQTTLGDISVPYCTPDEQKIIVEKLEEQFSSIHVVEKEIEENLRKLETLRQSILKKAFSGQLVPQDPNDEPASILLERIRAEKAKQAPKPRRKRKPRKAASA